jgi:hypothetical protein
MGYVDPVTATDEIAELLSSRRARLTLEQVGLQTYGSHTVPGLRREQVASLAWVSVYSADPGTRSQEALDLLASWTVTPQDHITATDH